VGRNKVQHAYYIRFNVVSHAQCVISRPTRERADITVLEIHGCSNPSPNFPNIKINMQYSEMTNTERRLALKCCHDNTIFLHFKFFYIFCTKLQNSWKIRTFNYTTINFRNIYCRYIILHLVSFDLM
jgi:hypothetical protein